MESEQFVYGVAIVCIIVSLIGITIYQYIKQPNLCELTIVEAEEKLKESGKRIRLGTKVGFIQPERSKFYLLGRIAEQIYVSPSNPDEYGIMNYKLYQIDVPTRPKKYVPPVEEIPEEMPEEIPEEPPKPKPLPPPQPPQPPQPQPPQQPQQPQQPFKPKKPKLFNVPQRKNTTKHYGTRESFFW